MAYCLVVDDEARLSAVLAGALRADGYEVATAATGAAAVVLCRQILPEVVLLDLGLPDIDGLDLISRLLEVSPLSRIVVLTGRNSVSAAVSALRAGARHFLLKPWDRDELLLAVAREARAVDFVETQLRSETDDVYWGAHPALLRLQGEIQKLAAAPLTAVLIEGETGSGKEVIAREIHRVSRASGPFVAVNCAAVPSELLETELFGHEKGAFTGADARRRGLVELARDGTLLLDEIGEMPAALQPKLLRFLQDQRFRRVGGEQELHSPSRVIAATHKGLKELKDGGRFRADLYFRLDVVRFCIPPLRERREDLLPLTYFLVERTARRLGRRPKQLDPGAEQAVLAHDWPGNVRELTNRIERALVLGDGDRITPVDLDLRPSADPAAEDGDDPVRLRRILEQHGWNIARAARRLGVERHQLRHRMSKHGLKRPEKK